jgi:hypothetical protein
VIRDLAAGRGRPAAVVGVAILLVAGCGSAPGSPGPVGPPSAVAASHVPGPPGLDWAVAAEIERPAGMSADPPSVPPVASHGGLGHPGHFSGQGDPFDVARIDGRLVAPGYTFPEFHASLGARPIVSTGRWRSSRRAERAPSARDRGRGRS